MTRPTRPAGPPYPDEPYPEDEQPQPRFTPRSPGPPGPPPPQGPPQGYPPPPGPPVAGYPYDQAPPPPFPAAPPPAGPRPAFQPAPPFPDAPPPAGPPRPQPPQPMDAAGPPPGRPQPTFTPHQPGERGRHAGGRRGGREGRPRPTFTPREDYLSAAAFEPPPPPGYQTQAFPQPFGYPSAPPRFIPRRDVPEGQRPPDAGDGYAENRTRVLEVPQGGVRTTGPERAAADTSPNLARSSKAMAFGTLASRLTGFLRTFVFLAALGTAHLADDYNNSNTLPNTVYYLMLGGIFTSVVVPLLVRAAKEDPDRGEAYAERIFTIGVIALLLITVVGTALAGPLVDLYAGNIKDPDEHRIMVTFAYFFIPQIFFYGMDSLLGAILNVRGRFGANMWTPVINNVVVIIVGALFILTQGLHRTPQNVSSGGIHLLAIGTTLGIVIQSIALFPVLRRAGFSMRLRWDLRRSEITEIGLMAGWMFGYVASQWIGNLVVQRVANAASNSAAHEHLNGVGYAAYANAWQLFQLPYAVVGISVISALLPRMSGHATDRRYSLVRDDFSKGVRIASVIVMPAAVFLAVLGPPLCEMLFAYGSTTADEARYIGEVFGAFSIGLLPFMLTQLQLRVFYSFHENRTPAIIGMVMLGIGVLGDLVALYALPASQTIVGLAFAYDLVSLAGAILAWPLLLRRVGSLDGWRITRSLVRMFLATLPGLVFAFVVMLVAGSFLHAGPAYGVVATLVGGGGALLLYAFCARLLGIEEFRTLMRTVGGRFG